MINIRKAKLRDIDEVSKMRLEFMKTQLDLINKGLPEHNKDFEEKNKSDKIFKNFLKRQIFSKNGLVLIAEINQEIAGFSIFIIQKNIPLFKLEKYCEILDMFVRKDFKGEGVSTKLKNYAINWCKSKGIKKMILRVLPNNTHAKEIYKKWGFSEFLVEMRSNI